MYFQHMQYTVYIEQDEDGMFIGSIPSIPGCHADGQSQHEMLQNLTEVLQLCLKNQEEGFKPHKFVGTHNLELPHA